MTETMTESLPEAKPGSKSEMDFNSLGILTLWALPLIVSAAHFSTGGASWMVSLFLILLVKIFPRLYIKPVAQVVYWLGRLTFFSTSMNRDPRSIRLSWFVLVGSLINTALLFVLASTITTIIPLLLVIYKRKWVIRTMYVLTFAPRREYVYYTSAEDRQKRIEMKEQLTLKDSGYYYFQGPTRMTSLIGYSLIVLTPFALILILVPLTVVAILTSGLDVPSDFIDSITREGRQFATVGILAIIPYLILEIPFFRGKTLSQWTTYKFAPNLIESLSSNKFKLGLLSGEYYIEEDSMMLDMSESTGFFSIFGNGRLFSILVTPLAFVSVLFRFILKSIDYQALENTDAIDFLGRFVQSVNLLNPTGNDEVASYIFLGLIVIAPIVLSFILPLIWVISDAELKRASWSYDEVSEDFTPEISDVENVGKSILNLFKVVLGVGAISSLATNITIIVQESAANGWLITAVVVIIGSVLTLPGAFFMAYRYLASGNHARGVNLIRFSGSQRSSIGVGTISRDYSLEYKLLDPPEEIRKLLGMTETENVEEYLEHAGQTLPQPEDEVTYETVSESEDAVKPADEGSDATSETPSDGDENGSQ
ncbi:MAG: hypothetical protein ACXAE3_13475 [Candidatus Kariarchaeaceae archaeon]|jgi:hypothetical protein